MNKDTDILAHARLHFHISTPDLEEVWLDGYGSATANLAEENNPYSQDSSEYELWQEGWWAGFYEEEPLFSLSGQTHLEAEAVSEPETAIAHHSPFKEKARAICQLFAAIMAGILLVEAVDLMV